MQHWLLRCTLYNLYCRPVNESLLLQKSLLVYIYCTKILTDCAPREFVLSQFDDFNIQKSRNRISLKTNFTVNWIWIVSVQTVQAKCNRNGNSSSIAAQLSPGSCVPGNVEKWREMFTPNVNVKSKTEYFTTDIDGDQLATIKLDGEKWKRVRNFKYPGSMVDETAGMDKEVNFIIQSGWHNWRKVSGVLCDRRVPIRLKGKVHKAVVRPALTYGLEAAPLKKLGE
ncbi:uncharacterized protein LOC119572460 [Penaeus monodon]|uniref:uncharacterized protein LOC119572460 n=1 Tax=Penaeus monodon TaxID=6687 RepID=UPI0018A75885|nr:uncharacterized protein LOC119572460 [Penaeus monodon]